LVFIIVRSLNPCGSLLLAYCEMLMADSIDRELIFQSHACYYFERTPNPKIYNSYFEQPGASRQNLQIIDGAVPVDCCYKMELVKNNLLVCNS